MAIDFLDQLNLKGRSVYWPNVKPKNFLANLRLNVQNKLSFYPGRSTNFCAYGTISYLVIQQDPLGYVQFLTNLYLKGEAVINNIFFKPPQEVRNAAGNLHFKGVLDIRDAEQMWFLTLADKFKGYLNVTNRSFDEGDENTFWAATNLAKYNRMVRNLCNYRTESVGSDLMRPWIKDVYSYLKERLDNNATITLYINNRIIHRKNHDKIKLSIPTHYVILESLEKKGNAYVMVYWDYGSKTMMELSPKSFRKVIFGITTTY